VEAQFWCLTISIIDQRSDSSLSLSAIGPQLPTVMSPRSVTHLAHSAGEKSKLDWTWRGVSGYSVHRGCTHVGPRQQLEYSAVTDAQHAPAKPMIIKPLYDSCAIFEPQVELFWLLWLITPTIIHFNCLSDRPAWYTSDKQFVL